MLLVSFFVMGRGVGDLSIRGLVFSISLSPLNDEGEVGYTFGAYRQDRLVGHRNVLRNITAAPAVCGEERRKLARTRCSSFSRYGLRV